MPFEQAAQMHRAHVFVDAAYLRTALEQRRIDWREVDLHAVARAALSLVMHELEPCSLPDARVLVYHGLTDAGEVDEAYLNGWLGRNDREPATEVRRGFLVADPRYRKRPEQKAVALQLAADALLGAARADYGAALLLAADADLAPVVAAIRELGPFVAACTLPGDLSDELRQAVDRVAELPAERSAWAVWRLAR